MLEVQKREVPDHNQHFLDGAVEQDELPTFAHHILMLYGDRKVIENIINESLTTPEEVLYQIDRKVKYWRKSRQEISVILTDYALTLLPEIDAQERAGVIYEALARMKVIVSNTVQWACASYYDDMVEGGALTPFKTYNKRKLTPKIERRLRSPKHIKHYINNVMDTNYISKNLHTILAISREYNADLHPFADAKNIQGAIDISSRRMEEYYEIVRESRQKRVEELRKIASDSAIEILDDCSPDEVNEDDFNLAMRLREYMRDKRKLPYRLIKQRVKKRRKVLAKSFALAATLLGQPTVSAMAKGEPIIIPGQEMNLQLQLTNYEEGHGNLNVKMLDRENVHLANLCVYFERTPVFDQIAAFTLYMQSGNEKQILNTGNLIKITTEGYANPLIAERNKERGNSRDILDDWEERRLVKEQYESVMLPVFRHYMLNKIIGQRAIREYNLTGLLEADETNNREALDT